MGVPAAWHLKVCLTFIITQFSRVIFRCPERHMNAHANLYVFLVAGAESSMLFVGYAPVGGFQNYDWTLWESPRVPLIFKRTLRVLRFGNCRYQIGRESPLAGRD